MPSCPRGEIVQLGEVGVYHCWSRCVRRAFLCGCDPKTGVDYEHRRTWIRDLQRQLAGLFGIEVAFRSEMSNHLHVVLRTRPDVVQIWSDREVARRWLTAAKLAKSRDGQVQEVSSLRIAMELALPGRAQTLRQRLSDPSWFMAILCENISRRSNREDRCSGVFWEGRYKCRELVDEGAILVCGIYVDLNQIRVGEAFSPETSTHTSAYDRIISRQQRSAHGAGSQKGTGNHTADAWLCELTIDERAPVDAPGVLGSAAAQRASDKGLLPISLDGYLQLLDASGRMVRDGKSGAIPSDLAPILKRLGVRPAMWHCLITGYQDQLGCIVGASAKLIQRAAQAGRRWYRGQGTCAEAFG